MRFGWLFNLDYHFTAGQVIWALGWCMVVLGGLVFLPRAILLLVCVALTVGHNALRTDTCGRHSGSRSSAPPPPPSTTPSTAWSACTSCSVTSGRSGVADA